MAVLHGTVGEWSRTEAEKRHRRVLLLTITFSMVFGFGLGIVFSFWPRFHVVLPLLFAFALIALPAMRLLDKRIHAMAKTRGQVHAGGAGGGAGRVAVEGFGG